MFNLNSIEYTTKTRYHENACDSMTLSAKLFSRPILFLVYAE